VFGNNGQAVIDNGHDLIGYGRIIVGGCEPILAMIGQLTAIFRFTSPITRENKL
jgi:hypothetical protein